MAAPLTHPTAGWEEGAKAPFLLLSFFYDKQMFFFFWFLQYKLIAIRAVENQWEPKKTMP